MSDPVPRRVALFGGSFDPVHRAHVAIARAAVEQAGLDRVIFLPAAQSPLKTTGPRASGKQRLEMLQAALGMEPWAEVSGWELDRPGPSYSWQTLDHFRETGASPGMTAEESGGGEGGNGAPAGMPGVDAGTGPVSGRRPGSGSAPEWFWLMGYDQWQQLERWQRWDYLAAHLTFLVFTRDGLVPQPRPGVRAIFLRGEFPGSSTAIRQDRAAGGRAWETLVTPAVAAIIRREGLYQ